MGTTWGGRGFAVAGTLVLAAAALACAGPAQAADPVVTVVGVTVTPASDDLVDGFATLVVDVALESTEPLADVLGPAAVRARPVVDPPAWSTFVEFAPGPISWERVTRVSGTARDGVWRATTEVSPFFSGDWRVTEVADFSTSDPYDSVDVSGFGASTALGTGAPPWRARPAPVPVRVVSGSESWTPRARVTDRVTGAGVPAPFDDYNFYAEPHGAPWVRLPAGWLRGRADSEGYLALSPRPVVFEDGERSRNVVHVYAGRGTRGLSWEAGTVLWPQVKWQANQRFSVSGRTVTASGNAWPAPAVYPAANPGIHLQQLVGRTWRTVATAQVRPNGRYTITWSAPAAGPQVVRVYKPGGATDRQTSVGTVLGFVTVTTR